MKLKTPDGTTHVYDENGNAIPIADGEIDAKPHQVARFLEQGFAHADATPAPTNPQPVEEVATRAEQSAAVEESAEAEAQAAGATRAEQSAE